MSYLELEYYTGKLLDIIALKESKRDDVAVVYALAIASREKLDWRAVNHAIMQRWSRHALKYIKRKAWKLLDTKL